MQHVRTAYLFLGNQAEVKSVLLIKTLEPSNVNIAKISNVSNGRI